MAPETTPNVIVPELVAALEAACPLTQTGAIRTFDEFLFAGIGDSNVQVTSN